MCQPSRRHSKCHTIPCQRARIGTDCPIRLPLRSLQQPNGVAAFVPHGVWKQEPASPGRHITVNVMGCFGLSVHYSGLCDSHPRPPPLPAQRPNPGRHDQRRGKQCTLTKLQHRMSAQDVRGRIRQTTREQARGADGPIIAGARSSRQMAIWLERRIPLYTHVNVVCFLVVCISGVMKFRAASRGIWLRTACYEQSIEPT